MNLNVKEKTVVLLVRANKANPFKDPKSASCNLNYVDDDTYYYKHSPCREVQQFSLLFSRRL